MVEFEDEDLSGSRFRRVNLAGTRIDDAFLVDIAINDVWVSGVSISGHVESLVVNGVEVAGYVTEQLESRHPVLVKIRSRDAVVLREARAELQAESEATLARARRLPAEALEESVNEEYSYLQTLRHLIFAVDRWITGPVRGVEPPYHPWGMPYSSAPPEERVTLDPDARPSLDEVLDLRRERLGYVDELLAAGQAALDRQVPSPNGGTVDVAKCVGVILNEEWWHNQYATRDLAILEERHPTSA